MRQTRPMKENVMVPLTWQLFGVNTFLVGDGNAPTFVGDEKLRAKASFHKPTAAVAF